MQAWSWDYLIFNDVDRWAHLFLLDASLVVWIKAWSLDYLSLMTLIVGRVCSRRTQALSVELRPGHWTILLLMTLIVGRVCSCRMQACSSEWEPSHGMILFSTTLMSVACLVFQGRKSGCRNAGLVIGLLFWMTSIVGRVSSCWTQAWDKSLESPLLL